MMKKWVDFEAMALIGEEASVATDAHDLPEQGTNVAFSASLLPLLSNLDNSVISPYGVATVLAMAAEGASEESLNEILATLGFTSLHELRASLQSVMADRCEAFTSNNAIAMMRGEDEAELLDEFKRVARDQYAVAIEEISSEGRPSVQFQNVASFKAQWLHTMERDASHEHAFCNVDGSENYPAFLCCNEKLRCYKGKCAEHINVQAVAIPYKLNGEEIPFELVLIDSEKALDAKLLHEIFSKMKRAKCEVEFPEVSIKSEIDLVLMMKELGIESVFDPEGEAFDHIATVPLDAKEFKQIAEILVDRDGTVARARTFMLCYQCASISENVEMRFCKSFCYFLRNAATGDILFMGRVNKLGDCERRVKRDILDF